MRYATPPSLATAFGCSRDDVHNLLKLVFDDKLPAGRPNATSIKESYARLIGTAIELRKLGVAPKAIKIALSQIENRIQKDDRHWLVVNSTGFAEMLPDAADGDLSSYLEAFVRSGAFSFVIVDMKSVRARVDGAIDLTLPMAERGWTAAPGAMTPAKFKARRDAAEKSSKKERVS